MVCNRNYTVKINSGHGHRPCIGSLKLLLKIPLWKWDLNFTHAVRVSSSSPFFAPYDLFDVIFQHLAFDVREKITV